MNSFETLRRETPMTGPFFSLEQAGSRQASATTATSQRRFCIPKRIPNVFLTGLLAAAIQPDRAHNNQPFDHLLIIGRDVQQVQPIVNHADQQRPEYRAADTPGAPI